MHIKLNAYEYNKHDNYKYFYYLLFCRFFRQFLLFTIYFLISATCFVMRPAPLHTANMQMNFCQINENSTATSNQSDFENVTSPVNLTTTENSTQIPDIDYCYLTKYCNQTDLVRLHNNNHNFESATQIPL